MADPILRRDPTRDRGQWILADTGADKPLLLSIGDRLYEGISLRNGVDFVARRAIVPHMTTVATTGKPVSEIVHVDGRRWSVQVLPVLGVLSGRTVAVLACYVESDQDLPPPPLVGSWAFVVTPPGPGQQLRAYWSPEMFDVYGVPGHDRQWWDGPQWLDELIAVGDRPDMRALFETFVADTGPVLRIQKFIAAPTSGGRYALRVAGRRVDEDGRVCVRGITARLHNQDVALQPTHVEALLTLSRDALAMIDPRYEVIYLTGPLFSDLGLKLPDSRSLPLMCHPEDLGILRSMLDNAAANLGRAQPPIHVRLACATGGWRTLEICGIAVHVPEQSLHVWCRIREPASA